MEVPFIEVDTRTRTLSHPQNNCSEITNQSIGGIGLVPNRHWEIRGIPSSSSEGLRNPVWLFRYCKPSVRSWIGNRKLLKPLLSVSLRLDSWCNLNYHCLRHRQRLINSTEISAGYCRAQGRDRPGQPPITSLRLQKFSWRQLHQREVAGRLCRGSARMWGLLLLLICDFSQRNSVWRKTRWQGTIKRNIEWQKRWWPIY